MTSLTQTCIAAPAPASKTGQKIVTRFFALYALAKQRRILRNLEPHLLSDIGLTHADAQKEGKRAIWDAPTNWSN